MSCLYHLMRKWYSFINVNANHEAWLEANSPPLCLHSDRSSVRQTLVRNWPPTLTRKNVGWRWLPSGILRHVDLLINSLWWGKTMSQICGHQRVYCSFSGWCVSMESHGDDGDKSWLLHQSSVTVLRGETSGESRRNWRRSENFAYQYLKYHKGSLTCRKILRYGTIGFTSHPKEGVLRIFIALKNPSPRPALNPRSLGPVSSTLTTTPRRRLAPCSLIGIDRRFRDAYCLHHQGDE
jgi:hypothetical protein